MQDRKMDTTNLTAKKREKMLDFLESLKEKHQDEPKVLKAIVEIEKALNEKKYGLVWEEHEEEVDRMLKNNIPVFSEVKEREIAEKPGDGLNFLIEGDNLHSLKLLEKTHKGKIDVIYIDPPYNTGNKDFIYGDKYVGNDDYYKNSKWLSFMEKRIKKAQQLLKEDGLIFISIDDNELYSCKILLDDIFGSDCFVSNICVEISKTQGMKVKSAQAGNIVKNHEYVLVYAKNSCESIAKRQPLYDKTEPWDNHFNCVLVQKSDNTYAKKEILEFIKGDNKEIYELLRKMNFTKNNKISSDAIRKAILFDKKIKACFYERISDSIFQQMACSISIPDSIREELKKGKIIRYKKYILELSSGEKVRQYRSLAENIHYTDEYEPDFERATIRGALWKGFYSDMMNVAKEGSVDFKNGKKPKRLIKQLIKWANRKNAIVLDFFAGSGTTAQAVLELNQEDGGNRKFILCTNNENNICEDITYERIKTVITGKKKDGSEYSKGIPANLKYYKTDFVPQNEEYLEEELNKHIIELIELQNGKTIDCENLILLSDDEVDGLDDAVIEDANKIYASDDILFTTHQKVLLKDKEVEVIPECFYGSEM